MARVSEGMCEDAEDARDGCMIVIPVYYKSSSRILSPNGDRHRVATTEARRFVYANIVLRASVPCYLRTKVLFYESTN
jgi:hypothetical protein